MRGGRSNGSGGEGEPTSPEMVHLIETVLSIGYSPCLSVAWGEDPANEIADSTRSVSLDPLLDQLRQLQEECS